MSCFGHDKQQILTLLYLPITTLVYYDVALLYSTPHKLWFADISEMFFIILCSIPDEIVISLSIYYNIDVPQHSKELG